MNFLSYSVPAGTTKEKQRKKIVEEFSELMLSEEESEERQGEEAIDVIQTVYNLFHMLDIEHNKVLILHREKMAARERSWKDEG